MTLILAQSTIKIDNRTLDWQKLLDAGAHIERKNEDEQTPLHLAVIAGHVKVINELLKRHAEAVQDDDENANTALHLAAMNG